VGTRTRENRRGGRDHRGVPVPVFRSKEAIYEAAVQEPMRELVRRTAVDHPGHPGRRREWPGGPAQMNQMLARFMSDSAPFLATVWLRS